MIEKIYLPVNCDYEERYVCNESYMKYLHSNNSVIKAGARYDVLSDKLVQCMEDLIRYCLVYNIDINIPEQYNITKIYNIVFSTGNFDPEKREISTCNSSIIYSSLDAKYIYKKFKFMCESVGITKHHSQCKYYYCWHTEDFAHNQIIHSYSVDESYIVTRIGVE